MNYLKDKTGKPILLLGMQTCNSSTGVPDMLERELRAVKLFSGNTLEAPVYWFRVEQEPGRFDFSDVDDLIDRCRARGLYLVLLWFGASKNGHPNYAPEWVKLHPEIYRLARGADGAHVASLSPHCRATLEADSRAFAALMAHLKAVDGDTRTVIAVQVENEMGLANTDMDYDAEAQAIYRQPVPESLRNVTLQDCGVTPSGDSWQSRFGRHAHEAFSAWGHAVYMNAVAEAGRAAYDLPMLINVMLQENAFEEPGLCYSGGAAVSRVLDIYKACAPAIDYICPDMYVPDRERYRRVLSSYARADNPLLIPESPCLGMANALNMMEAFADFDCVGMACFGASNALDVNGDLLPEARDIALSMKAVANVAPLLIRYRGTGRIHALVQQEFMEYQYLKLDRYHVEARFMDGRPHFGMGSHINQHDPANGDILNARGRALLIQAGEDEFFLAGCGVKVDFRWRPGPEAENRYPLIASRQSGTLNYLSVEEGHFDGDNWVVERRRCGDEGNMALYVHRGEVVRIRLNPQK